MEAVSPPRETPRTFSTAAFPKTKFGVKVVIISGSAGWRIQKKLRDKKKEIYVDLWM